SARRCPDNFPYKFSRQPLPPTAPQIQLLRDPTSFISPRFPYHARHRPADVTGISHDQGIAVLPPFRPAVLVAILFGAERQRAEERTRHHAALWRRRRGRRAAGDAGWRG